MELRSDDLRVATMSRKENQALEEMSPQQLFDSACEQTYPRNNRNWRLAARLWHYSAERAHTRSQFYLGTCFDFGMGVRKDYRKAMRWYEAAARQGHPESQYNLALGYRDGEGVEQNFRRAVAWFKQAALLNDAGAQRDLGYAYFHGRGTRRNLTEGAR